MNIQRWCTPHLKKAKEEREYLHCFPELSYKEFETTNYIEQQLIQLGFVVERPLETGCVAIIEGDIISDRVVALRADIDALPIKEEGEAKADFFSTRPGIAHCCGHDAHTANLLGVARVLAKHTSHVSGKVLLIFQPGEETLPGGGRLLCETGYLQKYLIQQIFGLHTSPLHKVGTIATRVGELMAAPDEFQVIIHGVGGHAACPHDTIDPVVIAADCISAFQTVVSRSVDPTESAVVTVGRIEGGTAHNIIPETVQLWGTIRTFSSATAQLVEQRMHQICRGIAQAHDAEVSLIINKGYPAVINDEKATKKVISHAHNLFGSDKVLEMERPIMAGEDFSFYQRYFPGAFFFVGSGAQESDSTYVWHHPKYNVDPGFFETAMPLMVSLAIGGSDKAEKE
tara:strand:+ start:513 stop:1709 length:1197 start_codon:yes stop_codon:yes gene_type:complete